MTIIVNLSKPYEVFKEILLAPGKLPELIRLGLRDWQENTSPWWGMETNHPFEVPELRTGPG